MKIDILCDDPQHPVNRWLEDWRETHSAEHSVSILRQRSDLRGGDVLFLVSCSQILDKNIRDKYFHCVVLHASDLPKGRGWSPHVWDILEGRESLTLSLIEAESNVDSGRIWLKRVISVPRHALCDEINERLFSAEVAMMREFLLLLKKGAQPELQRRDIEPSYRRKRTPADSELDPAKSISDQFDLIRVSDPVRYPAYFKLRGHTYEVKLRKVD